MTPAWMFMPRGSHTPGNGWPIVIDARMSSTRTSQAAGQEVEPDVVERVLDDLVFGRIDPQRDQRRLVHLALDVLFDSFSRLSALLLRRASLCRLLARLSHLPVVVRRRR